MKELKLHKSIEEQVTLIKSRGLVVSDEEKLKSSLANINYYRLSGYLHDFKKNGSDRYVENLTWERLKRIYDFDRKLSKILMFALEDIEETLKTRLSYIMTSNHPEDPLIYLKRNIYRKDEPYQKFLHHFEEVKYNNRKLPFVKHHFENYNGQLPMWVAVELFTMGNLQAIYNNLLGKYQKQLAKTYVTGPLQLGNWINNLTYARNHLAHYMRIYQFNFGRTPAECRNHARTFPPSHKIFDQIFVIFCMYSDCHEWNYYVLPEIRAIIEEYAGDIQLSGIGFPDNWIDILTNQ